MRSVTRLAVAGRGVGGDHHRAADDVAVTAGVLGGRVHHDVGAERDRLLQVGRGEGVVDDEQRTRLVGDGRDRLDVGDAEQRVGGRLDPDHPGLGPDGGAHRLDVGDGGDRVLHPPRPGDLVEQPVGASVGVARARRRGRRGSAGRAARHPRRPGRWRRRSRAHHPPGRRCTPPGRCAWGSRSGCTRSHRGARRCRPACRCSPGRSGGPRRRSSGPAPGPHGWRGRRSRGSRESCPTAYAGAAVAIGRPRWG